MPDIYSESTSPQTNHLEGSFISYSKGVLSNPNDRFGRQRSYAISTNSYEQRFGLGS